MKGKQQLIRYAVILVILAVVYWQRGSLPIVDNSGEPEPPREKGTAVLKEGPIPGIDEPKTEKGKAVLKEGSIPGIDEAKPKAKSAPDKTTKSKPAAPSSGQAGPSKVGVYDRFTDARLVDRDGNDGDSFMVKAGGREFELRLYFVDAPESYLSDRYADQRRRVAEQARELGGITPEEAVEVGKRAKAFTKQQLANRTFTIYTYWEQVYDGDRFYGFVELPDGSDLATRLVAEGLGRVHTKGPGSKEKPVPTPKGKTFFQARDGLEALEREAREEKRGAWGY
ncbi:MAG: thermonuclease family protein [Verrucomicrobiales bacterium]|nr:thermonuclease family protein [Verrucomicrobiales bacterium]